MRKSYNLGYFAGLLPCHLLIIIQCTLIVSIIKEFVIRNVIFFYSLTRAQMIQIMFYMSCVRKLHPHISMREYEHYLQKHITHLSIEEIGIFALAFFKTQTSILNDKLLQYTMQRVVEEIHTIPEVTLSAISKVSVKCNMFKLT